MKSIPFNVAQLLKERTGATRTYTIREDIENLDPEIVAVDALSGQVRIMRLIEGVLVTGVLNTSLGQVCDRCLTPFVQAVEIELEDEFRASIDIVSGASLPIAGEEEGNIIDDHHILDLAEVVRQRVLLSQPPHPLCRTDCQGLCPTCGSNLNEGSCDCNEPVIDPRWAALRELLH